MPLSWLSYYLVYDLLAEGEALDSGLASSGIDVASLEDVVFSAFGLATSK
jgi:hypothetical protein